MSEMGAADFKAHCLEVLDAVRRTRRPVVVTKRGIPVAKVVPADPPQRRRLGELAGQVEIVGGDVLTPVVPLTAWQEHLREWDELNRTSGPGARGRRAPARGRR